MQTRGAMLLVGQRALVRCAEEWFPGSAPGWLGLLGSAGTGEGERKMWQMDGWVRLPWHDGTRDGRGHLGVIAAR